MPKGSKFAEGYIDRSKEREAEEEDDREARIKALEESLKNEEIDQATFETVRNQIAGGDLSSTHLVKGLDFKLLERIRRGEDISGEEKPEAGDAATEGEMQPGEDVDDEFERMEAAEVVAAPKDRAQKKGQLSTVNLVPGRKRTRDQILAEMKAAREAAKAKDASALGTRFKKIGVQKTAGSRIERDSKGREVLIIVDEDGHEKRKVRKVAGDDATERAAFVPDKDAKPLGMEVPEYYRKNQEHEKDEDDREVNIFDDVGSDYDPLTGLESGSDAEDGSESDEGEVVPNSANPQPSSLNGDVTSKAMPPPPKPGTPSQARNYFRDSKTSLVSEASQNSSTLSDPAVLAALRKAKILNAASKSEEEEKNAEQEARLKKLLQSSDRDAEDMDLGFGTNRLADEEESEEKQIKLSAWGDEDDEGRSGGGQSKRKRGPKKRKGDGNNVADVMRVLEQRKGAKS